jgi:hypothetical protein
VAGSFAGVERPFIFWSSGLSPVSEFVAEDPLALDYIAQQVGLWLLPGLTTRTSRAGYYPMVLYGLTLAEVAVERFGFPKRDAVIQQLFERWERFWAIAVCRLYRRIPPEDRDAMRGVNGAKRAASSSPGERVPVDYKLIERQTELGALGAYLSSLRFYELVQEGTLVPTKLGRDLADMFWGDGGHPLQSNFREYALKALEPSRRTLPARHGTFTIERIGELSRLGTVRNRPMLQQRLWQALFAAPSRKTSPDYTPEIVGLLMKASQEGVISPNEIMVGATRGRWGEVVGSDLRRLLKLAVVFENFAAWARVTFDDVYRRIEDAGYILSRERLTAEAMPEEVCVRGARLAARLVEHPSATKLKELRAHGAGLLRLASACETGSPEVTLENLLAFHQRVQADRRHTGGWLRAEGDKVVAELRGYTAARAGAAGWTHDFKLAALTSMLRDLGRVR